MQLPTVVQSRDEDVVHAMELSSVIRYRARSAHCYHYLSLFLVQSICPLCIVFVVSSFTYNATISSVSVLRRDTNVAATPLRVHIVHCAAFTLADERLLDDAQLALSCPCELVLVCVPYAAAVVSGMKEDVYADTHCMSSAMYFSCTAVTSSIVGFSFFVQCIGQPTEHYTQHRSGFLVRVLRTDRHDPPPVW